MKDKDYQKLLELAAKPSEGVFYPANNKAISLLDNSVDGEIINIKHIYARDIKLHRAYFALIKYIYGYMPKRFKKIIPEDKFYNFLKVLNNDIDILFKFKNGIQMYEYKSISFSKMSEIEFRAFVKNQLLFIYDKLLGAFFDNEMLKDIIATIEDDFEKFFSKLFAKTKQYNNIHKI